MDEEAHVTSVDMDEDARKALVKEINDTLKLLGRQSGAPGMQPFNENVRTLLAKIAAMFELPSERKAREQA